MKHRAAITLGVLLAAVCCLLLTACGHHHSRAVTPVSVTATTPAGVTTVESLAQACPAGGGAMGCASGAPHTYLTRPPSGFRAEPVPAGVKFPDVSSYQGCNINWGRVDAPGAAVKIGESDDITDPCAAHNLQSIAAAHKAAIPYWFVRPVPIGAEQRTIVAQLKHLGITIRTVVIYTGPGTWPGGSTGGLSVWEAAYNTIRDRLPFAALVLSWQFTDGVHGPVTLIPGLGYGDVSVDYGLLALAPHVLVLDEEVPGIIGYAGPLARYVLTHDPAPAPKPAPLVACKPFKAQRTRGQCDRLRQNERHFTREITAQRKLLRAGDCYRRPTGGRCPAQRRRGDAEHAALSRLLATSTVQP